MCDSFELFHLSENATLQELKSKYFELALYAHPDRGGSCEQMHALRNAYQEVKIFLENKFQIENIHGATDLKEMHASLRDELDRNALPTFMDIYDETHDTETKFKNGWDKADNIEHATEEWGYSDVMLKSEYNNKSFDLIYSPDIETEPPPLLNKNMEHSIVPIPVEECSCTVYSNSKILTKGEGEENITFKDYATALGKPSTLGETLPQETFFHYNHVSNLNLEKQYEGLLESRANIS